MSIFKWESGFGHFSAFFELWTVFWPVLDTLVENLKHKKVAPVYSLNFPRNKNPNIDIWVPKMHFSKIWDPGLLPQKTAQNGQTTEAWGKVKELPGTTL